MKIGFVGLGKLGLPVALAIQEKGHAVTGYDISEAASDSARKAGLPIARSVRELVARSDDLIFIAVQTPHDPRYEGITRLPPERKDFDYTFLVRAVTEVAAAIQDAGSPTAVAVVSTVLPGTMAREVKPVLGHIPLVYNPSFIAMGTVREDYLGPEFVLLGVDDPNAANKAERFYKTITKAPVYRVSVKDAELIKVSYNTFIGMKLAFVNTLMEVCHKTGCDVDAVTGALKMAHRRLVSPAYLTAGMGDGGGCHPRDNIALSWLARELELSYDFFQAVMMAREKQAEWLADVMCEYDLPKVIVGTAFKANTDITTGSHALLVKSILEERGHEVATFDGACPPYPAVILIGNTTKGVERLPFRLGSVIVDPWRVIPQQKGVTVIGLGRGAGPGVSSGDRNVPLVRQRGS